MKCKRYISKNCYDFFSLIDEIYIPVGDGCVIKSNGDIYYGQHTKYNDDDYNTKLVEVDDNLISDIKEFVKNRKNIQNRCIKLFNDR